MAYYTFFSLAPLLIFAIALAGAFFGVEAAEGKIVTELQHFIGRDGAERSRPSSGVPGIGRRNLGFDRGNRRPAARSDARDRLTVRVRSVRPPHPGRAVWNGAAAGAYPRTGGNHGETNPTEGAEGIPQGQEVPERAGESLADSSGRSGGRAAGRRSPPAGREARVSPRAAGSKPISVVTTAQIMSRRALKILGAAYLVCSLAVVVAALAIHFLGQAVLESMVGTLGVIVLLGVL